MQRQRYEESQRETQTNGNTSHHISSSLSHQQQQQQQTDEAIAQPTQSGDPSSDWQEAEVISIEEQDLHDAVHVVDGQQDEEEDILPLVPATVLLPVVVAIPADEDFDMEELYSSMNSCNLG